MFGLRSHNALPILLLVMLAVTPSLALDGLVTGVVDGDTLDVSSDDGVKRIDLAEIDCPELDQPFGDEARQATLDLALYLKVRVEAVTENQYGQVAGKVFLLDGRQLSPELVSRGLAWWQSATSTDAELANLERQARDGKKGLWASSSPIAPWDWRSQAFARSLQGAEEVTRRSPVPTRRACIPRSECCKVCSTGKACGNSCISRSYTCHKGRGCSCNSSEIC